MRFLVLRAENTNQPPHCAVTIEGQRVASRRYKPLLLSVGHAHDAREARAAVALAVALAAPGPWLTACTGRQRELVNASVLAAAGRPGAEITLV